MKQTNGNLSRVFSLVCMSALILLATCSSPKPETPAPVQPQTAFTDADQKSIDSIPVLFRDTTAEIIRTRFAMVNSAFFETEKNLSVDSTLVLQLFPDVSITLTIESIITGEGNTEVWTLRPEGEFYGTGKIIISDQALYARIQIHTTVYEVFPVGTNLVRIKEINQAKFPQEAEPLQIKADGKKAEVKSAADGKPVITVLVIAPTPTYSIFCQKIFGIDYKKVLESAFTENLTDVFNAMESTGIKAVVKFECYKYKSVGGSLSEDLAWVKSDAGVATLRDKHKADLVCLLVPSASVCGRGYINYPVLSSSASTAFCVVKTSCALDNYSFAHELGHNMGMRHDRKADDAYSSETCNYGYVFKVKVAPFNITYNARSVMAYGSSCDDCARYGLYSNPMKKTFGVVEIGPMGVKCDAPKSSNKYYRANNRQQLIDAAPTVSNFR